MTNCYVCESLINISGGFWNANSQNDPNGMSIEYDDDKYYLCFDCIRALPPNSTASDVEQLKQYTTQWKQSN